MRRNFLFVCVTLLAAAASLLAAQGLPPLEKDLLATGPLFAEPRVAATASAAAKPDGSGAAPAKNAGGSGGGPGGTSGGGTSGGTTGGSGGTGVSSPVGKSVGGGPLLFGNLKNAEAVLSGVSTSATFQGTPGMGYQYIFNSSGNVHGPTVGTVGGAVAVTVSGCWNIYGK